MICAVTIELIRAPGGDVTFRIDRPFDREWPCVRRRCRFHPLRELNSEFVPHPGAGSGVFEKEVHHQKLTHFDVLVLLLVGARYRPSARIGGEIPG